MQLIIFLLLLLLNLNVNANCPAGTYDNDNDITNACVTCPSTNIEYTWAFDGECIGPTSEEVLIFNGNGDNTGTTDEERTQNCFEACRDKNDFNAVGFIVLPSTGRCYCESLDGFTCEQDNDDYVRYNFVYPGFASTTGSRTCTQFRTCAAGLVTLAEGTTTTDRTCKCAPGTKGRGVTKEDILNAQVMYADEYKALCLEAAKEARTMALAAKSNDGEWGDYYGFDYSVSANNNPVTNPNTFEYGGLPGLHGCVMYVHNTDYTRILWNNGGSDGAQYQTGIISMIRMVIAADKYIPLSSHTDVEPFTTYANTITGVECTSTVTCEVGQEKNGNTCNDCQEGKYDDDSNPLTPCKNCDTGKFQDAVKQTSCKSYQTCDADVVEKSAGTANSDRLCGGCVANKIQDKVLVKQGYCFDHYAENHCKSVRSGQLNDDCSQATSDTSFEQCYNICSGIAPQPDSWNKYFIWHPTGNRCYCGHSHEPNSCSNWIEEPATGYNTYKIICTDCPTGMNTNGNTEQTSCDFCDIGYGTDGNGGCQICSLTDYNSVISSKTSACNQKVCAVGSGSPKLTTYDVSHVDHETNDCVTCPAGEFSGDADSGQCGVCAAGTEATSTGSSSCTTCTDGKYDDDSNPTTACINCEAGRYQDVDGSTTCKTCEPGRYQDNAGFTGCKLCPMGRFEPNAGSVLCTECPSGKFQGSTGSTSCQDCDIGKWSPIGAVTCNTWSNCPAGKQEDTAPSYTADRTCKDCDAGTWSPIETNTCSVWTVCEANFETSVVPSLSNDRECSACPVDKWADYGNAACKDIPEPVKIVDNPYFTHQTLFVSNNIGIDVDKDKFVEALGITLNTNSKDIVLTNIIDAGEIITIKYKVRCLKDSDVLKTTMVSAEFPTNLAATLKSLINEPGTIIIRPLRDILFYQLTDDINWVLIIILICVGVIGTVLACVLQNNCKQEKNNRIKRM